MANGRDLLILIRVTLYFNSSNAHTYHQIKPRCTITLVKVNTFLRVKKMGRIVKMATGLLLPAAAVVLGIMISDKAKQGKFGLQIQNLVS